MDPELPTNNKLVRRLRDEFKYAVARTEVALDRLERSEIELEGDIARFETSLPRRSPWAGANGSGSRLVKLDVGGAKYNTTIACLMSKAGFFRVLCEGHANVQLDHEGCVFIDRSPSVFRYILNWMSGQPLYLAELSQADQEDLIVEADFYEIEDLQALLGITSGAKTASSAAVPATVRATAPPAAELGTVDRACALLDVELRRVEDELAVRRVQFVRRQQSIRRLVAKIEGCVSAEKITLQLQESGARFSTTVHTLTKQDGPLRRKFGAGPHAWQGDLDPTERTVFIDKDAQGFGLVLNLLRGYPKPRVLKESQRISLAHDLDYFGGLQWDPVPHPARLRTDVDSIGSAILASRERADAELYLRTLQSWLGNYSLESVIYRASRDGASAEAFHAHCDVAPASLVLIQSGSSIFGGFTSTSWQGIEQYVEASESWIFSLCNPFAIEPLKFGCLKPEFATFCDPHFGPSFGLGRDIVVWYYGHAGSFVNFPQSYGPDDTGKGCSLFTGGRRFVVTDVEVCSVAPPEPD